MYFKYHGCCYTRIHQENMPTSWFHFWYFRFANSGPGFNGPDNIYLKHLGQHIQKTNICVKKEIQLYGDVPHDLANITFVQKVYITYLCNECITINIGKGWKTGYLYIVLFLFVISLKMMKLWRYSSLCWARVSHLGQNRATWW